MKRFFLSIVCLALFAGVASATEFNEKQLALRNDIVSFLSEEGFVPNIDNEGDIYFKSEGSIYYIIISENNTNPLYLYIYHGFNYGEHYTKSRLASIVNEIQLYKGLKLMLGENSYSYRIEMFLENADHFRATFYKHMSIMKDADKEVDQLIATMIAEE